MVSKHSYKKLTWIDLESPTRDEVLSLSEEYQIPELVREEILKPTLRSKVDRYDNLIFLIMHFPVLAGGKSTHCIDQEIDFIIGRDFIITTHYEIIKPLREFTNLFEKNSVLDKRGLASHAGYLFYFMIKDLYAHSELELEHVNESIREIEKHIFSGKEVEMVAQISNVNRTLIDFKQAIRFHKEILSSFETAAREFFGENFGYYLSAMNGEYNKVQSILDGHREILSDLHSTNDSLLTTKTNDTIKKLTIMTFIILPLTLIASIFGMNMSFVFIHKVKDFYVVVLAMLVIASAMFVYFKGKKWF
jgi:magnesium transporter